MRDVFKNPPPTVQEACELFLKAKGVNLNDAAAPILREAVAFGSAAAAGRQMAHLDPAATDCNATTDVMRMLQEAEQIFVEANQVSPLPGCSVN